MRRFAFEPGVESCSMASASLTFVADTRKCAARAIFGSSASVQPLLFASSSSCGVLNTLSFTEPSRSIAFLTAMMRRAVSGLPSS